VAVGAPFFPASPASADVAPLEPVSTLVGYPSSIQIPTAAGVAVAADGTVYVADRDADRVVYLSPGASAWTLLTSATGTGSGLSQVSDPSYLFIDALGYLYISDSGNNRIMRWAPGATSGVVVAGKRVNSGDLTSLGSPGQTALDDDGNLYVADTGNSRVMRFDTFGEGVTGVMVAGTGTLGSTDDKLAQPMGLAVGPGTDPVVYVADTNNNRVMAWVQGDASGTLVGGLSSFTHPRALVRSGTDLYVADYYKYRIAKIDAGGNVTTVAGTGSSGWGTDKVRNPSALALVATGPAEFVIAEADRVTRWVEGASAGTVLIGWDADPGMTISSSASALRVRPDGVYVADFSKVVRFDPETGVGTVVAGGNGSGSALNQLGDVRGLAFDTAGNLYVSDSSNNRVMRWAPGATTGVMVAGTGTAGSGLDELSTPFGIDVTADGTLYVADRGNNRVVTWAPSATAGVVAAGGLPIGSGLDQFFLVNDVRVDASGNMYALDYYNHRVTRWAPSASAGVVVAGGNGDGANANQLWRPTTLALDGAGGVLVSGGAAGRVDHWPLGASTGQTIFNAVALGAPQGIDVDTHGRVVVVDAHYRTLLAQQLEAAVSLAEISSRTLADAPFAPAYTSPSGLAVSITATPSDVCSASAGTVSVIGVGTCTVTASWGSMLWQSGSTSRSFAVGAAPTTTTTTTVPPTPTTPPTTVPAPCGTSYTAVPGNAAITFKLATTTGRTCQFLGMYKRGSGPHATVTLPGTGSVSVPARNGSTYTVRITAEDGSYVTSTLTVGAPTAPAATATAGTRRFTVAWARPSSNGSSVRYYTVSYRKLGSSKWVTKRTTSRKLTVSVPKGTYQVRVAAHNGRGQSPWSQTVTTQSR
jgi:sugar lactone lactonase YvrE